MKKITLLIILIASLALASNAQQYWYTFANDTVKADTNYYPSSSSDPNTLAPSTGVHSTISTGVISFTFTHTDVTDSLAVARIEGRNRGTTTWTPLTGNAALSSTTTDGVSTIYTSTPLVYEYYRGFISCATGDTVAVTSPTITYKEK